MKIDHLEIIQKSIDFSKLLRQRLEDSQIEFVKTFTFNSKEFRNPNDPKTLLSSIDRSEIPIVYVIHVKNLKIATKLINLFQRFSEENRTKTKNKDRINVSRFNQHISNILYVGSSTTDFRARIKNHIGLGSGRVYSLHLSKWDCAVDYDLFIDVYIIKSVRNSSIVERFVVEIIEQQIWDELKPSFGKKSGL